MKKICLLIIFMLLLSGCTVNYNLTYENEIFEENLNVMGLKSSIYNEDTFSNMVDNYYNNVNLLVDYKIQPGDMSEEEILKEYETYEKNLINKDNYYGINFNHKYNRNSIFDNSQLVYAVFDNIVVTDSSINVSKGKNIFNNYSNLEEIVITFKTDKKVLETNSDEVKDNIYYWYINKFNYDKKTIKINFDKNIVEEEFNKNVNNISKYGLILFGCILIFGSVFILFKFFIHNKK